MNKKTKRQKVRNSNKQEVVITIQQAPAVKEEDLLPTKEGGKYMIPKTWMSEKQVTFMVQRTPPQHVYSRPAKGGGTWQYVTQSYIVKALNYLFGWNWDFEILEHGREEDQVWVKGKLTVKSPSGQQIIKTQFGRADIKYKKGTKAMLDFGNDLKSAASDSLKKCASLIGIASDIYGKIEMKQEAGKEIVWEAKVEKTKKEMTPKPIYKCFDGDEIISQAEYDYSLKMFKKPLCREHQKDHAKH